MSGVDSDGTCELQCCHESLNSCPGAHVEGSGLNSFIPCWRWGGWSSMTREAFNRMLSFFRLACCSITASDHGVGFGVDTNHKIFCFVFSQGAAASTCEEAYKLLTFQRRALWVLGSGCSCQRRLGKHNARLLQIRALCLPKLSTGACVQHQSTSED